MNYKLRETRLAKNMTQQELGEMVGLSKQNICAIERGRVQGSIELWEAIAKALKTPLSALRPSA